MGVIQGKIPIGKFWLGIALLLSLLLVACGAAAPVVEEKAAPLDLAPQQIPAATAAPAAAEAPANKLFWNTPIMRMPVKLPYEYLHQLHH